MAARKSTTRKKSTSKGSRKVAKVMREYKRGELKSGGRKTVAKKKQAVAIALSEARRAGAKIPKKGAAKKKSTAKKSPAKKKSSGARKSTAKRSSR